MADLTNAWPRRGLPGMHGDLGEAQHRGIAGEDAVRFGGLDHQIAAACALRERVLPRPRCR